MIKDEPKKVTFEEETPKENQPVLELPIPAGTVVENPPAVQAAAPIVPEKPAEVTTTAPATQQEQQPEVQQFTYADMPREEEEETEMVKRKTLAGDKYRLLVEMDDGTEQPSLMGSLGHLNLAIEVLKERIAVAHAMSENIKGTIKKLESRYRF